MPAAELYRLRQQINQLISSFEDPAVFHRQIKNLLDQYANHAYRAGQAVQPQPLLPSYRVPPLVMRQLELELGKTCRELPVPALNVSEALWQDTYLEPRLLATSLLGSIPVQEYGPQVIQKLDSWGKPSENLRIQAALMENGTVNLRRESPALLIDLIEKWLGSTEIGQQGVGLRALVPLIQDQSYENLPIVFRMLGPFVQTVPGQLNADIQQAVQALIKRSPVETAYFLRQALSLSIGNNTARLIRRCLPDFSPIQQSTLRAALNARNLS